MVSQIVRICLDFLAIFYIDYENFCLPVLLEQVVVLLSGLPRYPCDQLKLNTMYFRFFLFSYIHVFANISCASKYIVCSFDSRKDVN